jgi:hypothetical protein
MRVAFEPRVDYESRRQPLVHSAEIAHRGPNVVRMGVDRDILVDGSHGVIL